MSVVMCHNLLHTPEGTFILQTLLRDGPQSNPVCSIRDLRCRYPLLPLSFSTQAELGVGLGLDACKSSCLQSYGLSLLDLEYHLDLAKSCSP